MSRKPAKGIEPVWDENRSALMVAWLPPEGTLLKELAEAGVIRPEMGLLIKTATCLRCEDNYEACECCATVDGGIKRIDDFKVFGMFWSDKSAIV